jgi:beta-lactamase class A
MELRWIVWMVLAMPLWGQAVGSELLTAKTLARLAAMDAALDGTMGVAAIDLQTGERLCYHCDTWFPTASTIKVPLLVEVTRLIRAGKLRYEQVVPVSRDEVVPSSAAYEKAVAEGGSLTVRQLITIMIQNSDNAATNKLIDLVGGFAPVNTRMDEMNLPGIRLRRKMIDLAAARADRENIATPMEMARLAQMLYSGTALDAVSSREMLEFLSLVDGDIRKAAAPAATATKTGSLDGVKCEFGLVRLARRPFALAVFGAYLGGESPVPGAARILVDHFRKLDRANAAGRFLE